MVQRIEFEGKIHEFPDMATREQIEGVLRPLAAPRQNEEDRTGRLRTASSQLVRGASDVVSGAVKSLPIAQSKNRGDMAAMFDRIDAGENLRDPFDAMPVRQEIIAEYGSASPEAKAAMRSQYANPEDPRESAVYQAGEGMQSAVEKAMPVDPEYAQEFWAGSVPHGLGTTAGFAGVGLLGRGMGLGATVPAGVAGAAMSSAGQFEEALASGASMEDAFDASGYGGLTGAIEGIPIGRLFDRLDKITGGSVKRGLIDAVKQGSEEAIQEFVQTVGDNLIANNLVNYDPDRGTFEGAGEASGTGFTVGALMQIVGGLVVGRRARNAAQAEASDQQEAAEASRPDSVPGDYTPFYGDDGNQIGWISPDRSTVVPLNGGAPGPTGERQKTASKPVDITPGDEASPIDTADIAKGKAFVDDALASGKANRILREAGIPDVQSRIVVQLSDGSTRRGIVADASTDDRGPWAKVMLDNGETIEGLAENIAKRIAPEEAAAPAREADTQPATAAGPSEEQIAMQNDVLQRGGFPQIGQQVQAAFSDGTTVTGTVDAGYYLPDDTPVMRLKSEDGQIRAVSPGEASFAPVGVSQAQNQQEASQQQETGQSVDVLAQSGLMSGRNAEPVNRTDMLAPQDIAATALTASDASSSEISAQQRMTGTGSPGIRSVASSRSTSRASSPEDVISFLSRRGGIRDDEGHALLKSRDMKRFTPRSGPLVRKSGMSIDDAGEALHEAGYFGPPSTTDRPDTAQVLDLLERAMSGPTYTAEDQVDAYKAKESLDAQDAAEIEAEMLADIKSVSREMREIFSKSDIAAIMKIMIDEKIDAETAVSEYAERQAIQYSEAIYQERLDKDADAIPFFAEEIRPDQDGGTSGNRGDGQQRQTGNPDRGEANRTPSAQGRSPAAETKQPVTDTTDQGQQTVIPGAERIKDRELAERRMEGRKASGKPQKDADFGLFDTGARNQQDMFDAPPPKKAKPEPTTKTPAPEAGVSDSDAVYDHDAHKKVISRLRSGDIAPAELVASYKSFMDNFDAIKAEMSALTKSELARYSLLGKNEKKDRLLSSAMDVLRGQYNTQNSISYNPFDKGSKDAAYLKAVENATAEDIADYAKRVANARKERSAYVAEINKAVSNPETFEEFQQFVRYRGADSLTDEQRVRYDELIAEKNYAKREAQREEGRKVSAVDIGDTDMEIVETRHTRDGYDLFVVRLGGRVENDVYRDLLSKAKQLGGWYSRYRGNGAVPGFQFKSRENAEAFVALRDGDTLKPDATEDKTAKVTDQLRDAAGKIAEKADEKLSADRKVNTARRASMAANTEAAANKDKMTAETMGNIATAIENGDAKHLSRIRFRTDIEMLNSLLRQAQYERIRVEKIKTNPDDRPALSDEDVKYVKYPFPSAHGEHVASVAQAMLQMSGFKLVGKRLQDKASKVLRSGSYRVEFKTDRDIADFDKMVQAASQTKSIGSYVADSLRETKANYGRAIRLGFPDTPTLRAALREFLEYRGAAAKVDPVKAAERALIGTNIPGYFPTPRKLVERMINEAGIEKGMSVLEPEAGKGSIADLVREVSDNVDVIEPVGKLRDILEAKGYNIVASDFLDFSGTYDRVIMNPPFEKRQDVDHVRHAYDQLAPGGRLVAIMSEGPFFGSDKKAVEFREWLEEVGGVSEKNPDGSFKDSDRSTGVATRLVTIDKSEQSGGEKYRISKRKKNSSIDESSLRKRLADAGLQDKIAVKIVDQIKGGQAEASYVDEIITVAMTAENPVRALDHEIIHALRDLGVIRDLEWKALSRAAMRDTERVKDIKARYKDLNLNDDQIAEEAVAEMFADLGLRNSGAIKRTVKRISNFFEALGNWLRGSGFRSADDVFGAINRGEVGAREPESSADDKTKYSLAPQKKLSPFDEMVLRPSRSVIEAITSSTGGMIDALKAGASTKAIGESVDRWRTAFQDQYLPLLRVQNAVEESIGRKLSADENAYIGEELSSGRKGSKLEDVAEKHVRPLIEEMHAKGIKVEELEAYLYARHAPERNKRISEINPKFQPGEGSGMTDADAKVIMDAVNRSGKADDYKALAKRVDGILDLGMKERVDAGLLSQEQADQWKAAYKHYVPLRGRSEVDPFSGSDRPRQGGSGVSVSGKESQQAFGRETPARDILAYAIMQTEEAIIRAETNRVAQRVFKLAEAAPDDRFWKVNKVGYKPVLDPATDTVVYRPINAITAEDSDYTIVGKFDGKQRRLTFNRDNPVAARMAASLRNLEGEKISAVVKYGGSVNRFLSMVNTSLNPEFVITNAFRDLQTAGINLAQYDEKGLIKNTLKDYPKALAGSMKGAFGKDDGSEWVKAYNEFRAAGGRVYFNQIEDVDQQAKKLKRVLSELDGKSSVRKKIKTVFQTIENINLGVESAIRLSAFKNARKAGMTPEQAASLAKNLTVNFNRRGTYGPLMNSMYLFFNASVQGSTVLLQAAKSRRVQKVLAAAAVTGALVEIMNVMASGYDDDGELIYDKISDFDKSRNIIIMVPGGDGQHIKIPLPYGYNAFFAMGRAMVDGYRGKEFGDIFGPLATTIIDSFNPIGGSESLLNLISPTIADPIVDLTLNRDFADRPIMPNQSQFGPEVPDSQRYWDSVSPVWREVTDFMNEASGGDVVRPGAVDISPETLEHLFGVATGAAGTFVQRNAGLIGKLIDPTADVSMNDIAFARKLIGQKPSWYDKGAAYERMDRIEQTFADLKSYSERGMGDEANALVSDEAGLLALRAMARSARKALSQIRKEKDVLTRARDNGDVSKADYANSFEILKKQEQEILTSFNRSYIESTNSSK